ncbi:MAG: DUF6428 family protein [Saprospiraceae bacterium]
MKLSEVKSILEKSEQIGFQLPDGEAVPAHYHVTEVGLVQKHFIDCGGTVRKENVINFQLWYSHDYDHRIHPDKLLKIIDVSEKAIGFEDYEVEVEYQRDTIGKFGLDYDGNNFLLVTKKTDCLAKDNCGIPVEKVKKQLIELTTSKSACCGENSTCC